jgi:hypothetical protein
MTVTYYRYRYELRNGGTTIATGHFNRDEPLQVGDRIEIGGSTGVVHEISPILGEHELRLIARLELPE